MKEIKIPKIKNLRSVKEDIEKISINLGYELTDNGTESDNFVVLSKELSFLSFGERVTIKIIMEQKYYNITIESESKFIQLFDWGSNVKNEEEIALALTNQLT